ncbi:MAG: Ribosomal RNA small subunit methyltransferase E [Polaribacter sp. SA4-10]|nr:MAG: Ribosomal RNA small subunit methyltransferase E [Polaribacter sp. SA4-10]
MQLFYNSELTKTTKQITFDKIESKHIVRVLRKEENDILKITNGNGYLFEAKIKFANDKKCIADIITISEKEKPWNYYLHIAIAPTKNKDRIEWFLEKATEIGIDEITPIICSNSENRKVNSNRFEKIIQSAMKQSLKFTLPKLNAPLKFNEFISQNHKGKVYIAHCEEQDNNILKSLVKRSERSTILIGPEGDFSSEEIKKAMNKKIPPVSLGYSRLRTETAAIVAVNIISFIND